MDYDEYLTKLLGNGFPPGMLARCTGGLPFLSRTSNKQFRREIAEQVHSRSKRGKLGLFQIIPAGI